MTQILTSHFPIVMTKMTIDQFVRAVNEELENRPVTAESYTTLEARKLDEKFIDSLCVLSQANARVAETAMEITSLQKKGF